MWHPRGDCRKDRVRTRLQSAPVFERAVERRDVGILKFATDCYARRDSSHTDPQRRNQPGEVQRRCVALHVGAGGDDDLPDLATLAPGSEALEEGVYPQFGRADPGKGVEDAVEHMVEPPVHAGALDRDAILRLRHDADGRVITARIKASCTHFVGCKVAAPSAKREGLMHGPHGIRQRADVLRIRANEGEREAKRGFLTDPGQAGEQRG